MAKLMIGTDEVIKIMIGTEEVSLLSMGGETIPVSGSPAPTPSYTAYDYIQTDGACWFETNYIPSLDTKIELNDIVIFSNSRYSVIIGGCLTDFSDDGISVRMHSTSKLGMKFGTVYSESYSFSQNQTYDIAVDKDYFIIDQTSYNVGATQMTSGNTYTMYIGAEHNNQGAFRPIKAKFGEIKIYTNNVLVADFVPAEYQGSIGFWDTVANTFRPNLGTGTPIAGNNQ